MQQNMLPPGITQEMIDKAKADYGTTGMVYLVDLISDQGDKLLEVLIRRPNRMIIQQFELHAEFDPGKAREILVNNCLLSHKDQVKGNDEMFAAVVTAVIELFPIRKATIIDLDSNNLPEGITSELVADAITRKGVAHVKLAQLQKGADGKEILTVLVCTPSRKDISDFEKWSERQPNKAKNILIDSAILSHKETIKEDDWLWYAAANAATQLKPKGTALIKNC